MDDTRVRWSDVTKCAARKLAVKHGLPVLHRGIQWEALVNWYDAIDELALPTIYRNRKRDGLSGCWFPDTLAAQLDGRLVTVPLVVHHEGYICAVAGGELPWGNLECVPEANKLRIPRYLLRSDYDFALVPYCAIDWES